MGFGKQLEKQKPAATIELVLDTIRLGSEEPPVLELAYAGKGNAPYMSAILKAANDPRRKNAGGKITERKLDDAQALDAQIFANTVVKGWQHVCEDETPGVPTPFSAAKCEELLLDLAQHRNDLFVLITSTARDADNFPTATDPNAGTELGKK